MEGSTEEADPRDGATEGRGVAEGEEDDDGDEAEEDDGLGDQVEHPERLNRRLLRWIRGGVQSNRRLKWGTKSMPKTRILERPMRMEKRN